MNITGREWDRMVVLFKEVLARHQFPSGESQELLAIIDSVKPDIVAAQ
jgi:hemoglobin